ncbi:MAG: hypothetical protein MNPFHGCM_02092 [Gemmatimonadaceae bacterium]|nr:hypothetical protein [Gemmatimonadaceae bacterium]
MSTTPDDTPELSVSVICFTTPAHLRRCLEALLVSSEGHVVEVIVPHDATLSSAAALTSQFPGVWFLDAGARATPAELRARAACASRAPLMAFLEDHCMPAADWVDRVLAAHRADLAGVGGSVEKGFPPGRSTDSTLNWAVYLTDYSRYMLPMAAGPAFGLSDCNVSYRRTALESVRSAWSTEFHENVVHDALRREQATLWFDPTIVVYEQRDLTLGAALRDRFSFGRLFGSSRVSGASLSRRLVMTLAALLMPPVLVWRVAKNLFERRRYRGQLVRCLPHLVLVATTWMLGESIGYLSGRAGKSLSHRTA